MKKNKIYALTALASIFIGFAAWSYTQNEQQDAAFKNGITETATVDTPQSETVELKDAEGNAVNLSDFEGKIVFINNWATWCRPCTMEMPSIQKLRDHFKSKDLVFVMISYDRNVQTSIQWMKNKGYTLPVYSRGKDLPQQYITQGIPATFVLDKTGQLVFRHVGMTNYNSPTFIEQMEKWLK